MDVRNCRSCRRLFNYIGGKPICPECRDKLDRKFIDVREYIKDNPIAGLQEVADANEVDVQQIREWIKEGRLELVAGSAISANCDRCGAPIQKGRLCAKCAAMMTNSINNLVKGEEAKRTPRNPGSDGPKMRFRKFE